MMVPSYMPVPTALVVVLLVAGVLWYFWEQVVGATATLVASGWLPRRFAPWLEPDPLPAHPTLQSAIDVVAGHSLRTRHRGEEERRALDDLKALVDFTSACGMDFNQAKSWQDSFPSSLGAKTPQNVLVFLMVAYLNMRMGVETVDQANPPRTRSLLTLVTRDAPRLYHGLHCHNTLKQLLEDAGVESSREFNILLNQRSGIWDRAMDQAKAIFGKPGMDTLQVRPLFIPDAIRIAKTCPWTVRGHRDYCALMMFAKYGTRALLLLLAEDWRVHNEEGTDNWRITIKDVKIYGHRQLKEVTIWFYDTDGYRFGLYYNQRNYVNWLSVNGRSTLFHFGTASDFHNRMQHYLLLAGYPKNYASAHSWRVGVFNKYEIEYGVGEFCNCISCSYFFNFVGNPYILLIFYYFYAVQSLFPSRGRWPRWEDGPG